MIGILANTITADIGLIPGYGIIGPFCGLPLSVLAAVIERPVYSMIGVRRHAVWYSIRANTISLLIGYLFLPALFVVAGLLGDSGLLVWPFVAVLISTVVERRHMQRHANAGTLPFAPILMANIASAAICLMLLIPVGVLDRPDVKHALRPYQLSLSLVLGVGCLAAVIASFVITRRDRDTTLLSNVELSREPATTAASSPPG